MQPDNLLRMEVGSLIKCSHDGGATNLYGFIVKLRIPPRLEGSLLRTTGIPTWAEIIWHNGRRTWEDMETSLETCFEVIT